jgi:hypothetical protein
LFYYTVFNLPLSHGVEVKHFEHDDWKQLIIVTRFFYSTYEKEKYSIKDSPATTYRTNKLHFILHLTSSPWMETNRFHFCSVYFFTLSITDLHCLVTHELHYEITTNQFNSTKWPYLPSHPLDDHTGNCRAPGGLQTGHMTMFVIIRSFLVDRSWTTVLFLQTNAGKKKHNIQRNIFPDDLKWVNIEPSWMGLLK